MKYTDASDIEIATLLEAVYQKCGYDFSQYSRAHIKRRIMSRIALSGLADISQMKAMVMDDEIAMHKLLTWPLHE